MILNFKDWSINESLDGDSINFETIKKDLIKVITKTKKHKNYLIQQHIDNLAILSDQNLIDKDLLNNAISWINKNMNYWTPMEWFSKTVFDSYKEWFLREIDAKRLELIKSAIKSRIVSPCEAFIQSTGELTNAIKLGNTYSTLDTALREINIKPDGYTYTNFKIDTHHYHGIHMPMEGRIVKIKKIQSIEKFFGKNPTWCIEIKSHKTTIWMLISVSSCDEFQHTIEIDKSLNQLDLLGFINTVGNLILIYPASDSMVINHRHVFVGDNLIF